MKKGDIYFVNLSSGFGHEQYGFRPVVLISESVAGLVVVVPLTKNLEALRFPYTLSIVDSSLNNLEQNSVALIFQIKSVDKNRLRQKIGVLSSGDLKKIDLQIKKILRL